MILIYIFLSISVKQYLSKLKFNTKIWKGQISSNNFCMKGKEMNTLNMILLLKRENLDTLYIWCQRSILDLKTESTKDESVVYSATCFAETENVRKCFFLGFWPRNPFTGSLMKRNKGGGILACLPFLACILQIISNTWLLLGNLGFT